MNEQDRIKRKECADLYMIIEAKEIKLRDEIETIINRIAEVDGKLGIGIVDNSHSFNAL